MKRSETVMNVGEAKKMMNKNCVFRIFRHSGDRFPFNSMMHDFWWSNVLMWNSDLIWNNHKCCGGSLYLSLTLRYDQLTHTHLHARLIWNLIKGRKFEWTHFMNARIKFRWSVSSIRAHTSQSTSQRFTFISLFSGRFIRAQKNIEK